MRYSVNFDLALYDVGDKWNNANWNSNFLIIDEALSELSTRTESISPSDATFTNSVTAPNFIGNSSSSTKLRYSRSITIGSKTLSFDGTKDLNYTLDAIGASPLGHVHDYLPLNGGTLTGQLIINPGIDYSQLKIYGAKSSYDFGAISVGGHCIGLRMYADPNGTNSGKMRQLYVVGFDEPTVTLDNSLVFQEGTDTYQVLHSHNYVNHVNRIKTLGNVTCETGATSTTSGLSMQQIYNNGYMCGFGNVINLRGNGQNQIALQWASSVTPSPGRMWIRNKRDQPSSEWNAWQQVCVSGVKYTHNGGIVTIKDASYTPLEVVSTSNQYSSIKFQNSKGIMGFVGQSAINGSLCRIRADFKEAYELLDSSQYTNWVVPKTGGTFSGDVGATSFNSCVIRNGLLDANYKSNFRGQTKGNTTNGFFISAIRTDVGADCLPIYGTGIAFGGGDTHGYLMVNYNGKDAYIGGGSANVLHWTKAISLEGHTHEYLPLTGGTLSGDLNTRNIVPTSQLDQTLGDPAHAWRYIYGYEIVCETGTSPIHSHAIKLGKPDENYMNFYEWGGVFGFYNTAGNDEVCHTTIDNGRIFLNCNNGSALINRSWDSGGILYADGNIYFRHASYTGYLSDWMGTKANLSGAKFTGELQVGNFDGNQIRWFNANGREAGLCRYDQLSRWYVIGDNGGWRGIDIVPYSGDSNPNTAYRAIDASSGNKTYYFLHSGNYTDYTVPKTGGTFAGTVNIGNFEGAHLMMHPENGTEIGLDAFNNYCTYFIWNATMTAWRRLELYSNSGDASVKTCFRLSDGGTQYTILHSGNYSDYAIPNTGGRLGLGITNGYGWLDIYSYNTLGLSIHGNAPGAPGSPGIEIIPRTGNCYCGASYSSFKAMYSESYYVNAIGSLGGIRKGTYDTNATGNQANVDICSHWGVSFTSVCPGIERNGSVVIDTRNGDIRAIGAIYNAVWNDYAEYFERGEETEPGDIIAVDSSQDDDEIYIKATYGTIVCGIHSDTYGHIVGGLEAPPKDYSGDMDEYNKKSFIPVGMTGRVNCKVIGPVKKGDKIYASELPGIGQSITRIKGELLSESFVGYACGSFLENGSIGKVKILLR